MTAEDFFWFCSSLVGLLIVAVVVGRRWLRRHRATQWPSHPARVVSTALKLESRGGDQSAYAATVSYAYDVDDRCYQGQILRQFLLKGSADKWLAGYPVGRYVVVHRNPSAAADSMLFDRERAT